MEGEGKRAPKAIVVGGSIAGLSCAHALIGAGWDVTVIEKTMSAPTGSPSGAGLSLEPQAIEVVNRWLGDPSILSDIAFGVAAVVHQTYDKEKKAIQTLRRDSFDDFISHRSVHWTDLHSVIRRALPSDVVLWGHKFLSLRTSDGGLGSVRVEAKNLRTDETVEFEGDLLVAADGSMSAIRQHFLPGHKMRYSGYSAWRGVFDYSDAERVDAVTGIRRAYPELGNCLYFDYADGNHCVFFQINSNRLNWLWYFNTPESGREGTSVTKKVDEEMIREMHEEARRIWNPELAELMKETKAPFINLIYDSDPLPRLFWDNVVLVGDAAHPTTPHASKSTNMSILDAEVLGLCVKKWGAGDLPKALAEYQAVRHPVVSAIVLQARELGRFKQGLPVADGKTFRPNEATSNECDRLPLGTVPSHEPVTVAD